VDHTLSGNSPDAAFAAGEANARAHAAKTAAAASTGPASATEIDIDNFAFAPKVLTVPVGSNVTWWNKDDVPHKIQSADKRFDPSPLLDTKATYATRFTKAGEYRYFCSLHPVMQGTIIVQ
jgi:plastocyanin